MHLFHSSCLPSVPSEHLYWGCVFLLCCANSIEAAQFFFSTLPLFPTIPDAFVLIFPHHPLLIPTHKIIPTLLYPFALFRVVAILGSLFSHCHHHSYLSGTWVFHALSIPFILFAFLRSLTILSYQTLSNTFFSYPFCL